MTKRERGKKKWEGGREDRELRGKVRRLREKGKSKEGQSKEEGNEGGDLGEGEGEERVRSRS